MLGKLPGFWRGVFIGHAARGTIVAGFAYRGAVEAGPSGAAIGAAIGAVLATEFVSVAAIVAATTPPPSDGKK